MSMIAVTALAFAFAVSVGLTVLVRFVARRRGFVAHPRADRWHRRPTALLGGIAIALGFAVPVLSFGQIHDVGPIVGLSLLVAGLGLIDDLFRLGPGTKLVSQTVIAAAALFLGYRLGWTGSLTVDSLLTVVWLVGLANAFNLLDNMDGLAAGVAAIGAAGYLVLAVTSGTPADVVMLSALVGATLGFLVFNVHPASIFMGDTGSLFLGFTVALLATRLGPGLGAGGASAIIVPVAVLSVPIFDTTLVTFIRSLAGRPISAGGRDHSSHRLVALGLPEQRAVLVLYGCAAAAAVAGLSGFYLDVTHANILLGLFTVGLAFFGVELAHVRVYNPADLVNGPRHGVVLVLKTFNSSLHFLDVLLDICITTLAYYTAYRVRFRDPAFVLYFPLFLHSLPLVVATTVASLWAVGAYRGRWRHFGLRDAAVLVRGTALAAFASVTAVSYLYRFERYSRGVFVISAVLTLILLSVGRASFAWVHRLARRVRRARERVVLYGAGATGEAALREARSGRAALDVVGVMDDASDGRERRLQGVRMLGGFDALIETVGRQGVDGVILATSRLDAARLEILCAACAERDVFLLRYRSGFESILTDGHETGPTGREPGENSDEVSVGAPS
ncbi:MAG TPA: hypothetical protein VGK32_16570 [Vicinamibacterales bacterium]|jgi:UDP-GlcNAc:undecaprenyl-phosphate GlcNAc-1-phosphate transferase